MKTISLIDFYNLITNNEININYSVRTHTDSSSEYYIYYGEFGVYQKTIDNRKKEKVNNIFIYHTKDEIINDIKIKLRKLKINRILKIK